MARTKLKEQTITLFGVTLAQKTFLTIVGLILFAVTVLYAGARLGSQESVSVLKSKASTNACTKSFTVVARPVSPTPAKILTPTPKIGTPTPTKIAACINKCSKDSDCKVTGAICKKKDLDTRVEKADDVSNDDSEYQKMKNDQPISCNISNKTISGNRILYSVISNKNIKTGSTMRVYIKKVSSDPKILSKQPSLIKEFKVTPGKKMKVVVDVPECGKYSVRFGSDLTRRDSKYNRNKDTDEFAQDSDVNIPCNIPPMGCCVNPDIDRSEYEKGNSNKDR